MPETKYERDTNRFDCLGLDLNRPYDSVKPSRFPVLKNVRSIQAGRVEPRLGLTDIAAVVAGQSPVHSARRLNDPANSTYTRIIGAGTHVAYGQTSFTDLDSGYSGDPLALVPWRPLASPSPFMYVADRSRMRKVSPSGSLHTIGLPAPPAPPAIGSISAANNTVDQFQATAGWAQSGTAGAPSLQTRISTTITQIVFDSGTTGWASIQPTSMANIGYGMRMVINSGGGTAETVSVQAVYPGFAATTIAAIIYDSGTSGECSLVLTNPYDKVQCDAIIRNTTVGPENARILAVTRGPNGETSLRISTTNTWAAGNTVQVLPTFRTFTANTHVAAETLTESAVRTALTSGTGSLTKTGALDLSIIGSGIPSHPDDFMHISIKVSDPTVVTELKVLLDVDSGTNDFTRNYYWRSFRVSDITPAASNLQSLLSTRQQIVQRNIIDAPITPTAATPYAGMDEQSQQLIASLMASGLNYEQALAYLSQAGIPYSGTSDFAAAEAAQQQQAIEQQQYQAELAAVDNAISQQMESGVSQWVELTFRLSDLIRVGTDESRTLRDVAAIRVTALVTGSVNLDLDSWMIQGGFGPDTWETTATPYLYRFRARNPATNVASNFSPASRYPVQPFRQFVNVAPAQYAAPAGTSLSTTDFVLDIERFGGEITDWHYVGTTANSATPAFNDTFADDIVAGQPLLTNDNYQPWPIIGSPAVGATGTVAGTTVNDVATNFNTSWAPGTRILINNQPYTIYRVISTARLELVENAGSQTSVVWRIDEPTILAQPLPCLWEEGGNFFACGDPVNPGRFYYSNPDSETTVPNNYYDLTSPSEPLMNGVQYNVRTFIWSSENLIQILRTSNPSSPFRHENVPNGKGLFSRWALLREPAPFMAYLSKSGLEVSFGSTPTSITDSDLYPLFPNEGNLGSTVNGISAPNIVAAQATNLRLAYYDDYLYFDYIKVGGGYETLLMNLNVVNASEVSGGWFRDSYTPNVVFHYGEEGNGVHALLVGTTDTHLYQYSGFSDNGTAIACIVLTPSRDQGDPRLNKLYGDIALDADTAGVDVSCTALFNNNTAFSATVTVNTASRLQTAIPLDSAWRTARNISLSIGFSVSTSSRPLFYIWEPRWTFESAPISALSWEISPSTFGMENFKSIGLCKITHVSSADLNLTFTIDGVAQTPIVIPNSGGIYEQTIFRVPVMKAKLYKVRVDSTVECRLDPRDSFIEVKPWGSDRAYDRLRVFGDFSMVEG